MEFSDKESESDVEMSNDILGPEDLFNDEADEDGEEENNYEEPKEKPEESSENKIEKKIKQPRIVKNPRVTLNFNTLSGNNGLGALKKLFENFKFKGNGHEKEDLTKIMGILQQWMCYKLCPSYDFESCMLQLEALGKKRMVQVLMKKYRLGMDEWGDNNSNDEYSKNTDVNMETNKDSNKSEFDLLLDEELAFIRSDDELSENDVMHTQSKNAQSTQRDGETILTPEQLERIARNRKLAEERRLKRMGERCEGKKSEAMETNQQTEGVKDQEISLESINLEENS